MAVGCTEKHVKGSPYSFHIFPKDPKRLEAWLVKMNRLDTSTKKVWRPKSDTHRLCAKHFTPDCFTMQSRVMHDQFGAKCRGQLKPDAVPTIFAHKRTTETVRPAYAKRQKNEVSKIVYGYVELFDSILSERQY